jgi:Peptidase family M28
VSANEVGFYYNAVPDAVSLLHMQKRFSIILGLVLLCALSSSVAENVRYETLDHSVIESRLGKYAGNNKQREATLKQMFSDAGCDDQHLSEQPVSDSKQPNVICVLPGSSDKTIIVGAHFDRVPDGDGVVDNWSGASLLPSLYESLKTAPRHHSYIFIGFTDEERGLIGSSFYAHKMTKEQIANTTAMINMDTLGLAATEIWGSHANKGLNSAITYVAKKLNVPISNFDVEQLGAYADSVSFERKIPSITIHSVNLENWRAHILHTSKDKYSAMHLDSYYESYQLIAAYIAFLDQVGIAAPEQNKK